MELGSYGQRVLNSSNFGQNAASGDAVFFISIVLGLMLWALGLWWFWHAAFTARHFPY